MDEIRGEDFRKAWPNALARALHETGNITSQLDEQRRQVEALAETTHQRFQAAERQSQASSIQYLDKIADAQNNLVMEQRAMMQSFTEERAKLDKKQDLLDKRLAIVLERERELKVAQHEFENMPFWDRLLRRT